jgi:hypothetical protein
VTRQPTGADARALYDQAAGRARNPRARDPQATGYPAAGPDPDLMRPCRTVVDGQGGRCGAPKIEHELEKIKPGKGQPAVWTRTWCSRQDGPRNCPCQAYTRP